MTRRRAPRVDPDALAERVLSRALGSRRRKKRRRLAPLRPAAAWPRFLAAAAALLAGLGLFLLLGRAQKPAPQSAQGDAPFQELQPEAPPLEAHEPGGEAGSGSPSGPLPEGPSQPEALPPESLPPVTPPGSDPLALPQPPAKEAPSGEGLAEAPGVSEPQGTQPASPKAPPPAMTLLAAASLGKVEVQAPGSQAWRALEEEERLGPGQEVRTAKGRLDILVGGSSMPENAKVLAGSWLRLAPKTQLLCAPQGPGLRLLRGEVFFQARRPLLLSAGPYLLSTGQEADLSLNLSASGVLEVALLSGAASLQGAGEPLQLQPGQRIRGGRQGKLGRPRRGAQRPRWLDALRALGEVVYDEPFEAWGERGYIQRCGSVKAGVARASLKDGRQTLSFGTSEPRGGIFRYRIGSRVRLRFRLSESVPLTLQLMNHTQQDNFHASLEAPPAGAWAEALFALDRFQDNAKEGKRPQEGDLFGYVSLYASPEVSLEVEEVVVFVPQG